MEGLTVLLLACERPSRTSYDSHDLTIQFGDKTGAQELLGGVQPHADRLILVAGGHDRDLNAAVTEAWKGPLDVVATGGERAHLKEPPKDMPRHRSEVSGLGLALQYNRAIGRGLVLSGRNRYTLPDALWTVESGTSATVWPSEVDSGEDVCAILVPDLRYILQYVDAERTAAAFENRPAVLRNVARAVEQFIPSQRLGCQTYTDISTDDAVAFLLEDERRVRRSRRASI